MSVKYIDNMKTSRGVHTRWAELIGSYSFTISHARVIVERLCPDVPAISRAKATRTGHGKGLGS